MTPDVNQDEQSYAAIKRLGCVNELSVLYSCPGVNVFAVIRALVNRGVLERTPAGAVGLATHPPLVAPAAAIITESPTAQPRKPPKPPRKYFAYLNPKTDLKKQIASRIVQYLAVHGYRVQYMNPYHSLHGDRAIGMVGTCGQKPWIISGVQFAVNEE